jgi:hypothetical protein
LAEEASKEMTWPFPTHPIAESMFVVIGVLFCAWYFYTMMCIAMDWIWPDENETPINKGFPKEYAWNFVRKTDEPQVSPALMISYLAHGCKFEGEIHSDWLSNMPIVSVNKLWVDGVEFAPVKKKPVRKVNKHKNVAPGEKESAPDNLVLPKPVRIPRADKYGQQR